MLKFWKFVGQCGIFVVPAIAWGHGFLAALGSEVAFVVIGCAIGYGMLWAIEASVDR